MECIFQEEEGWQERSEQVLQAPRQERPVERRVQKQQKREEISSSSDSEPDYNIEHVSRLDSANSMPIDVTKFKHKVENFKAGSISKCLKNWKMITSDRWILNMVKGYKVDFLSEPWQDYRPRPLRLDSHSQNSLDKTLAEFLELGIIEPCNEDEDGFYSTLFTTPKRDGSDRVIFNLSDLNWFIDTEHFKMDTVKFAIDLMTKNCYFGSIDYKHAYYSVSIAREYRKYFRFKWKGKTYQFTVMAQGLCTAPRDWTKLFKPPLAVLREAGFTILGYIDDTIFIEESANDLRRAMNAATKLVDSLGVTISVKKSVFEPVQKIEYLGFILDSRKMTVTLTQLKKDKIERIAEKLSRKHQFTIRELSEFIGNVVAAEQGVWSAPLHYKRLEMERNRYLAIARGNYDYKVVKSQIVQSELNWWIANIQGSMRYVVYPAPELTLYSDASGKGWGGHIKDGPSTGGDWSEAEAKDHINVLELKGAFLTLQAFASEYENCHIKMMLDNTTAIACINKFGSSKPKLLNVCLELFAWAQIRNNFLSAAYVPGVENVLADKESRTHNVDTEWQLKPKWFQYLCEQFGTPDIDLFASRINTQLKNYVSWRPDPTAQWVDAFSMSWKGLFVYLFPPFSLMTKVLQQLDRDHAKAVVVYPNWSTMVWFARLQQRRIGKPIALPPNCLTLPQSPDKLHPLGKRLHIYACVLQGKGSCA